MNKSSVRHRINLLGIHSCVKIGRCTVHQNIFSSATAVLKHRQIYIAASWAIVNDNKTCRYSRRGSFVRRMYGLLKLYHHEPWLGPRVDPMILEAEEPGLQATLQVYSSMEWHDSFAWKQTRAVIPPGSVMQTGTHSPPPSENVWDPWIYIGTARHAWSTALMERLLRSMNLKTWRKYDGSWGLRITNY